MNHSIHSADRTTHLKIVMVALAAGIALAGFGLSMRSDLAAGRRLVFRGTCSRPARCLRSAGHQASPQMRRRKPNEESNRPSR